MGEPKKEYLELMPYASRVMGVGICPNCGHDHTTFKLTKGGFATYHCLNEVDGGCQTQAFIRCESGTDKVLKKYVKKWQCKEARQIIKNGSNPVTENAEAIPVTDNDDGDEYADVIIEDEELDDDEI